jgi:hypothetical protein
MNPKVGSWKRSTELKPFHHMGKGKERGDANYSAWK